MYIVVLSDAISFLTVMYVYSDALLSRGQAAERIPWSSPYWLQIN